MWDCRRCGARRHHVAVRWHAAEKEVDAVAWRCIMPSAICLSVMLEQA
jgi:hypothetical protein